MSSLLLLMGLLLVAYLGSFLVGGERSVSGVGLPSSVEWVVLGVVVGPQVLGVVSGSLIDAVQSVVTVGLAWLMLTAGVQYACTSRGRVRFGRVLVALPWGLVTAASVFAAVWYALPRVAPELVPDRLVLALALAAISCETTRHAMRWVRERYGATGPLIDLLEDIACAEDLVPIGILVALFGLAGGSKIHWLGPARVASITVSLGVVLGVLCALLLGREFRLRESWGTVLGISLLGIGVSATVGLAYVVVSFLIGAVLVLVSRHAGDIRGMLAPTERGALLPLLIVCGVRIQPHEIIHTVSIFGVVLGARVVSKLLLARVLVAVNAEARRAGRSLGLGMLSSGSLTMCIGLVCATTFRGPVGDTVLAVAAALCVAGELVGPPALRAALRRVGELHPERSIHPPPLAPEEAS
ncbi:MAG TPA: potassium transporter Kef [Polyangiaceae bacterium]|jgi:hypothetical protein